jgi:hypothetical protein
MLRRLNCGRAFVRLYFKLEVIKRGFGTASQESPLAFARATPTLSFRAEREISPRFPGGGEKRDPSLGLGVTKKGLEVTSFCSVLTSVTRAISLSSWRCLTRRPLPPFFSNHLKYSHEYGYGIKSKFLESRIIYLRLLDPTSI